MDALNLALQEFSEARLDEAMNRAKGGGVKGDFEGSVVGSWVRLDQGGAGIVLYRGREYPVRSIGFTSLPKGTTVELSYAQGIYFAKF